MKNILLKTQQKAMALILLVLISASEAIAQRPQNVPRADDSSAPENFTLTQVLLFIVLPAVVITGYFIFKNRQRMIQIKELEEKLKAEEEQEKNKNN